MGEGVNETPDATWSAPKISVSRCNALRSAAASLTPNSFSNRACAARHAGAASRAKAAPFSVTTSRRTLLSPGSGSLDTSPSRSNGRRLRPSVVRSNTSSAAKAWTLIPPANRSRCSSAYCEIRNPNGAIAVS